VTGQDGLGNLRSLLKADVGHVGEDPREVLEAEPARLLAVERLEDDDSIA